MEAPRYITQISKEWLDKVDLIANLVPGPGLRVRIIGGKLQLEIDQEQLKIWLFRYIQEVTTAVNTDNMENIVNNFSLG